MIVRCRVPVHSDFMFKWLWLTDLILSVQTLSSLGNMCFIMQLSEALGSIQQNQSFKAFVLIISCNQQQSSETMKWKSNFVLIPARFRWALRELDWVHSALLVHVYSLNCCSLVSVYPCNICNASWSSTGESSGVWQHSCTLKEAVEEELFCFMLTRREGLLLCLQ